MGSRRGYESSQATNFLGHRDVEMLQIVTLVADVQPCVLQKWVRCRVGMYNLQPKSFCNRKTATSESCDCTTHDCVMSACRLRWGAIQSSGLCRVCCEDQLTLYRAEKQHSKHSTCNRAVQRAIRSCSSEQAMTSKGQWLLFDTGSILIDSQHL